MATVRPFKAIRPNQDDAAAVASLPYDVMNRHEAKKMAEGNPKSYLHVVRSEIDLPDEVGDYDPSVYEQAKAKLQQFIDDGVMIVDDKPMYYIYRQMMKGRVQTGIVGTTSIDEYMDGRIKKHELTREVKEIDRINHFDVTDTNTEPIFLSYRHNEAIEQILADYINHYDPEYDFRTDDGVSHILWAVRDDAVIAKLQSEFEQMDALYIADGHHRSASSAKVGLKRRQQHPDYTGEEEFNFFMSVLFSDKDLYIMDYNRVVKDLNGLSEEEFMTKVGEKFDIVPVAGDAPYKPMQKGRFGLYLGGRWYELIAKDVTKADNLIDQLDVSILQNNLLEPILGIADPRTDKRIDFVGGIRGLHELERRVHEDMALAFSFYPTTMEDLLAVADAGMVMPPKSTWFEPKLRSGLFAHKLSD